MKTTKEQKKKKKKPPKISILDYVKIEREQIQKKETKQIKQRKLAKRQNTLFAVLPLNNVQQENQIH